MFYSFSIIPFIIIIRYLLIYRLNAITVGEDKMLIEFVKNGQKMQISEFTKEKYEAYFGIVYFMRKSWKCDKIAKEFEEYERTECQKYRKYLDILYEYLRREYLGIPTVKPKFVFKKRFEIEGPIIYAVNCLIRISQLYFRKIQNYEYKLNVLFGYYENFEPKLLNEERLRYYEKLSINEMILELAIDPANEWQTNLDGIILKNCGEKFEEYLQEMFKKAEERAKDDEPWKVNIIINDNHWIIVGSKFDDDLTWTEGALFSEFVKGLATNFEKFFKMAKEYSNNFNRMKEKGKIYGYKDRRMVSCGLNETEKMKKHLQQKYEARLGLLYLMRKNWQCSNILNAFDNYKRKICQTNRKYLDILNEYLFRLYVQGKNAELANKFSAVKPIFSNQRIDQITLTDVIKILNKVSQCFWQKDKNPVRNINSKKLILENEVELNYEIKEEENWFSKFKFKQNLLEKINGPKNGPKNMLSNELEENLRQEFEQKKEKMYEHTKQNAKIEMAKLEKAIEKAENDEEKEDLEYEYKNKFDIFNSSPLS